MATWLLKEEPTEPKRGRGAQGGASEAQQTIDALGIEDDEFTAVVAGLAEVMQQNRETRACVMNFLLLDLTCPSPTAMLSASRRYDKQVKAHKEQQAAERKNNPAYKELRHGFGSPYLQTYHACLTSCVQFLKDLEGSGPQAMDTELEDPVLQLRIIETELQRLNATASVAKSQIGIRQCSCRETKENDQAKILLCIGNKVELQMQGHKSCFSVQECLLKVIIAQGAEHRTLPAPASKKERRVRAVLDGRRKAAAKKGSGKGGRK